MTTFLAPPLDPMHIVFDSVTATVSPTGPVLTRRMSSLEGLFAAEDLRRRAAEQDDPIVYTVASSPVPELPRELPQSITTILPGTLGGEFYMTKGHQHPDPQGEIYLCLRGTGGLLTFDGRRTSWIEMTPGVIGYMPPGWAHRSVNTGDEEYQFLAVYPGSAGHDYQWVVANGMGERIFAGPSGPVRRPFTVDAGLAQGGGRP
jgi:glucose-6-phosphate isomerase